MGATQCVGKNPSRSPPTALRACTCLALACVRAMLRRWSVAGYSCINTCVFYTRFLYYSNIDLTTVDLPVVLLPRTSATEYRTRSMPRDRHVR